MTSCIIHIGMHKTGSTSIQHSLDGFADERFVYADLGDSPNHSLAMYSAFSPHASRHHLHRSAGRDARQVAEYIARTRAKLDAAVSTAGERTLLISGEDISVLPEPGVERMREFFDERFDEVSIVGYVRPPAGFVTSAFQERLKGGSLRDFDVATGYRNYQSCFGKFDAMFGRERVRLWKFDPPAFPEGCAVRDFCARLGIALPASRIVRLNESLSREMVSLLYTYARHRQRRGYPGLTGRESMQLSHRLGGAGQKFRLSPDVVRPMLEENAQDIRWMEARLGAPLAEDLGEPRAGDVRSEDDLLRADADMAERLRQIVARDAGQSDVSMDVVDLLHALHPNKGAKRAKHKHNGELNMKISDLIAEIRTSEPKLLEGIPDDKAEQLLSGVFREMNAAIANTRDGVVRFSGLGHFKIRQVEKEVDGEKASMTRIIFRRADGERGKGAAAEGEE